MNPSSAAKRDRRQRARNQKGFSLIELLVVLGVGTILTALAISSSLATRKKLFATDEQASQIMDFMRDANLQALSKRRAFRVEIDDTDQTLAVIDENGVGAGDDRAVRWLPLALPSNVRLDSSNRPNGVAGTGLPGYNAALFEADTLGHFRNNTRIIGHNVWRARFRSDGTMVNTADVVSSATLYLWPPMMPGPTPGPTPNPNTPTANTLVRAITVFGPSGGIKLWAYNGTAFVDR